MGLALACAGATAAPTVTVLISSAAARAMSVRYEDGDISNSPFLIRRLGLGTDAVFYSRVVPIPENRQEFPLAVGIGVIPQPRLGGIRQRSVGNIHRARRVESLDHRVRSFEYVG